MSNICSDDDDDDGDHDDDHDDEIFFDKYLSWLLLSILTHKCAFKVQHVESYFFNLFIINQTHDKVSHLLFKQKEDRVFQTTFMN